MKRTVVVVLVAIALIGAGFALFEAGMRRGAGRSEATQATQASSASTATNAANGSTSSAAATSPSTATNPATGPGAATAATAPAAGGASSGGTSERIDPKTGRRVLYWHDPMVPGQKFDKPGKSPFMNMELVPVFADEAAGGGTGVAIDPRLSQSLGIRTAEVVRGRIEQPIEVVGSVAYNERDVAVVQARANGWIEKLHVRAPLDPVRKGQVLADVYVPDWVAAQEEFFTVRRMKLGDALVDGARQRMRLAGMSDEQVREVETSGTVQPRMHVVAPIGGVVGELQAREGMTVMAGAMLFRLNGLGSVWVNAEVPETAAQSVRPGMAVEATTSALPGKVFRGRVGAVLPEVNATTRTLKARIEVANAGGLLVPGMFANVHVTTPRSAERLLVPSEAVIRTGRRSVVMVAQGDGRFAPVDVETGLEANGTIEVRKGLREGQKVVASGQFLVDSEASLKGVETRMQAMPATGAPATAALPASSPSASTPGTPSTPAAPAAGDVHRASGRIEGVDGADVMIAHGPVESLKWPPMTMGFRARSGGLPAGTKPGDAVQFEFRRAADGQYEIVSMQRVAGSPPGKASR